MDGSKFNGKLYRLIRSRFAAFISNITDATVYKVIVIQAYSTTICSAIEHIIIVCVLKEDLETQV